MPTPPYMLPGEPEAVRAYQRIAADAALADDVRDTCLVALSAVGRSVWDQSHQNLQGAHVGEMNFKDPVNCWTSVLKWAVISGAISERVKQRLFQQLQSAAERSAGGAADAVQNKMVELIYTWVAHSGWAPGDTVPVGAMVYHGRYQDAGRSNPIAHVTIHVGNNQVVGCWAAAYLESPALRNKFELLTNKGWCGDTMISPIDAFGQDLLAYSIAPFWRDLRG